MARQRKRRTRLLSEILKEAAEEEGESPWTQIPADLLAMVAQHLDKADAVHLCATCKAWARAAQLIRRPKSEPPLLIFPPEKDGICELFDAVRRKTYFIHTPELSEAALLASAAGWLLLLADPLFFLNPFTREKIALPYTFLPRFPAAASRCAVSSQPGPGGDCVVFFFLPVSPSRVLVQTFQFLDCTSRQATFRNPKPFEDAETSPIFCNGHFYCLGKDGKLGVYNPGKLTWTVVAPKADYDFRKSKAKYLMQSSGELFVVCDRGAKLGVFWLERKKMKWAEVKKLGNRMMFVDSASSFVAAGEEWSIVKNRIYFTKMRRYTRKACVSYSLDSCRYHPSRELYECPSSDCHGRKAAWIQPQGFDPSAKHVHC